MSDTPLVTDPVPPVAPPPESPQPAPVDQTPEAPAQQTHPWTKRSFGFQHQDKWLQGTAYHKDHNLDASGWYGDLFYESLEDLINRAAFTPDQQKIVLETIQRLVR